MESELYLIIIEMYNFIISQTDAYINVRGK